VKDFRRSCVAMSKGVESFDVIVVVCLGTASGLSDFPFVNVDST